MSPTANNGTNIDAGNVKVSTQDYNRKAGTVSEKGQPVRDGNEGAEVDQKEAINQSNPVVNDESLVPNHEDYAVSNVEVRGSINRSPNAEGFDKFSKTVKKILKEKNASQPHHISSSTSIVVHHPNPQS